MLDDEQRESGQRSRREGHQNNFPELTHRGLMARKSISVPRIVGGVVRDRECGETDAVHNNQPKRENQQGGPSIQNRSLGGYSAGRSHSDVR